MIQMLARLVAKATTLFTHLVTAVQVHWVGCAPAPVQRIYYANHVSHGDFVLILTALRPALRKMTRPVAGADYWLRGYVRRFIATRVFRSILIERHPCRGSNPITAMSDAIDEGASLIFFPEGTRNMSDTVLLPFKSGLYHLARKCPETELVPVWLANLNRVLPKGEFVPVPLLCTVTFGTPLSLRVDETKAAFLTRTRDALLGLSPKSPPESEAGG